MVALFKSRPDSPVYRPLVSPPRSLSAKFFALVTVVSLVYVAHSFLPSDYKPDFSSLRFPLGRQRGTCPPKSYASGQWLPSHPPTNRTEFNASSDVYEFVGFQGCASTREVYWHLAADNERLWDRFPAVASWKWSTPSDCEIQDLVPERIVTDLVEQGGWLLIGGKLSYPHPHLALCVPVCHRAVVSCLSHPPIPSVSLGTTRIFGVHLLPVLWLHSCTHS